MLQSLELLAQKSRQLAEAQEAQAQKDERRRQLLEERDRLRREHAALKQAVEARRSAACVRDRLLAREAEPAERDSIAATAGATTAAAVADRGESTRPESISDADGIAMQIPQSSLDLVWKEAALRGKEDQLHALKMAYRLSGKYVSLLSNGRLGLRFDVFYKADFQGTYYAVVRHDPGNDALVLENHTLPHFIDVSAIAQAWLPTSVKLFMEALCDQLHLYVARREELRRLVDAWGGVLAADAEEGGSWHPRPALHALRHDDAVRHVEIRAAFCARKVLVTVWFGDVSSSLPTSVTASLLPPGGGATEGAIHGLPGADSAQLPPVPETCPGHASSWREVMLSGRLLEGMELLMDAAANANVE
eukprot:jgi/Mesvir1/11811/Mv00168-RA.1